MAPVSIIFRTAKLRRGGPDVARERSPAECSQIIRIFLTGSGCRPTGQSGAVKPPITVIIAGSGRLHASYLLSAADDCSASYRKNQDLMRHPKARICRQTIYLWRPQW